MQIFKFNKIPAGVTANDLKKGLALDICEAKLNSKMIENRKELSKVDKELSELKEALTRPISKSTSTFA